MKYLWRIKWETIIILMVLAVTIKAWFLYSNNIDDTRILAIATICTFMFVMFLFSYNTIKNIRHELLK